MAICEVCKYGVINLINLCVLETLISIYKRWWQSHISSINVPLSEAMTSFPLAIPSAQVVSILYNI